MTNKKRKGFTIVELVIVIAVIAILAGVLIPTFASIIDKANQSSDIQAVRQMNVVLMAESVEDKPTDVNKVIEIVSEAGYDTEEKRTPKSNNHGFYWHRDTNTIILVKTTNPAELIYPLDNKELRDAFDDTKADWANSHDGFEDLAVDATPVGTVITKLSELKAALTIGGDENYYLGNDITISEPITISEDVNVTIDLNGNTLMIGDPEDSSVIFEIEIKGELTITDSNSNSGKVVFNSVDDDGYGGFWLIGGTLNLNGVNVEGNRVYNIYDKYGGAEYNFTNITYTVNDGGCAIYSSSSTSAIIEGSTLSGTRSDGLIEWSSNGTLTLKDVTIDSKDGNVYNYGVNGVNATKGSVEIYGGTYNCSLHISAGENSEDVVKINDYSIKDENEQVSETKTATFEGLVNCGGGNVKGATVSSGVFKGGFTATKNTVNITGGTFEKTVKLYGTGSTINIFGGEFEADLTEDIIECANKGVINICGGKFKGKFAVTRLDASAYDFIHIFNYNTTDPNVTYPMFYYKDTTTGEEKYTSFDAANYSQYIDLISGGFKGTKGAPNVYVIVNNTSGLPDNYSPDAPDAPSAPTAPTE